MPALSTQSLLLPSNADVAAAFQQAIPVQNPAVASDVTYKVSADNFEVVVSTFCTLTTSAAAGNRQMRFRYLDGDGIQITQVPAVSVQGPGASNSYTNLLILSGLTDTLNGPRTGPLAPLLLYPGWSFVLNVGGVQAGDQLSQVYLVVQRFPTGTPAGALAARVAPAAV